MPIMIWIAAIVEAAIQNWADMGILLVRGQTLARGAARHPMQRAIQLAPACLAIYTIPTQYGHTAAPSCSTARLLRRHLAPPAQHPSPARVVRRAGHPVPERHAGLVRDDQGRQRSGGTQGLAQAAGAEGAATAPAAAMSAAHVASTSPAAAGLGACTSRRARCRTHQSHA
jgi:hypothetical protein